MSKVRADHHVQALNAGTHDEPMSAAWTPFIVGMGVIVDKADDEAVDIAVEKVVETAVGLLLAA